MDDLESTRRTLSFPFAPWHTRKPYHPTLPPTPHPTEIIPSSSPSIPPLWTPTISVLIFGSVELGSFSRSWGVLTRWRWFHLRIPAKNTLTSSKTGSFPEKYGRSKERSVTQLSSPSSLNMSTSCLQGRPATFFRVFPFNAVVLKLRLCHIVSHVDVSELVHFWNKFWGRFNPQ